LTMCLVFASACRALELPSTSRTLPHDVRSIFGLQAYTSQSMFSGPADMNGDTSDRQGVAGQAKSGTDVPAGLFLDLSCGYPSAHTTKCNQTPTQPTNATIHPQCPSRSHFSSRTIRHCLAVYSVQAQNPWVFDYILKSSNYSQQSTNTTTDFNDSFNH
jgi:hypothetical protein